MLDSTTKKRIDDLRNILVGKIPTPQRQVEQITTGLIYKFMYDMDVGAVEMDGVPSFFVDDYEKYSWKHLFDAKLGGADKVKLYSDAIENMYTNPYAPELFRDIFKNSFLPFRDPSTLNMFLKEINEFHYSHSEKLGDAFEYLLSFMGSQGDAGQFRTPRHIIDFIVEIVNPQKNETILDPACGTAGFLISSYKHILNQNTDKESGDKLNAKERKQVGDNLVGYDISPDMTRISLVNMYLHQFKSPKIYEYDTLSSEDKWNEYYDVILANPPFFSPKGGIQPHSRFGVQSTRAEVLFVDYIMEHLKPTGRAGIVVPEGIIFDTGNAYKTLRKKLVEDCLVGVISLPAGVFQPYSVVKTSILILDKELNQKSESIFFAKVENDGFSLGKKRKKQGSSDLPEILNSIRKFLGREGNASEQALEVVSREKILSNKTCSLVVGNYVSSVIGNKSVLVKLGEVAEVNALSGDPKKLFPNGSFTYIDISSVQNGIGKVSLYNTVKSDQAPSSAKRLARYGDTLVSAVRPNLKGFAFVDFDTSDVIVSTGFLVLSPNIEKILPEYLYYCILSDHCVEQMIAKMERGIYPRINQSDIKEIQIPLPPIEVQQQIISEIEGYQKIIDGCRQVVENYKPTIDIDPSWEVVKLDEIVLINPKKSEVQKLNQSTSVSFVPMEDLNENEISFVASKTRKLEEVYSGYTYFKDNDILLAKVTPCFENGKAGIARELNSGIGFGSSEFYVLRCGDKILPEWVYINIITQVFRKQGVANFTGTSGLRRVPKSFVENYKIPVPDIDTQLEMVKKTKSEIAIIDGNKRLVEIFTQKIQDRISKVWGE